MGVVIGVPSDNPVDILKYVMVMKRPSHCLKFR
ncbi:MAG: hypothetical protein ACJAU6_002180 [Alphaproteobacteria bacterium]